MKQGKLVTTHNVSQADICVRELSSRPKLEMVGLGLVYGSPGLGKSTWATRTAYKNGYVYIRLEATTTTKTFASHLLKTLNKRFGFGDVPVVGSSNRLFQSSLALLEQHPETVILIDEIDYAFKNPALLGAIRDIVDETLAIVILVGMENAMERLLQINRYYFDRCSQFYQFTPATVKDLAMLCATIMEVPIDEDVVRYLHRVGNGNLRQTINIIDSIEQVAKAKGLTAITIHDVTQGVSA